MVTTAIRRVVVTLFVLGLVIAVSAAFWVRSDPGVRPAVADGGAGTGASVTTKTIKTIVLPGEILANHDEASFPFTTVQPPTEGVAEYKVPLNNRLVIESAYATIDETYSDPGMRRTAVSPGFRTFYPLPSCAFLGYERDYGLQVGPASATNDEATYSATLQGPIYVEGGRTVKIATSAVGGNSDVVVYVTLHGYLEAAVNPQNPKPPTNLCR